MVFFGANDAKLPDSPGVSQTVSVAKFESNLEAIVTHPAVKAHEGIRLLLVTPGPVDEALTVYSDSIKGSDVTTPRRTVENTARYAEVVRKIGAKHNVPVVDIWARFMDYVNVKPDPNTLTWPAPPAPALSNLLHDGLHFTPAGYRILYDEIKKTIQNEYPDQVPGKLPFVLPAWDEVEAWR